MYIVNIFIYIDFIDIYFDKSKKAERFIAI